MSDAVLYAQDGHVVTLTMNRPDVRNAIGGIDEIDHFVALLNKASADRSVRAVILTGAGSAFAAGGNVKAMREKTNPHPIRVSVYVLHEALKKLRKVDAEENPDEYNQVKVLYRGMKDMKLNFAEFAKKGGTEVSDCREHIVVAHSLSVSAS